MSKLIGISKVLVALQDSLATALLGVLLLEVERANADESDGEKLATHGGPQARHVAGGILLAEDGGGNNATNGTETDLLRGNLLAEILPLSSRRVVNTWRAEPTARLDCMRMLLDWYERTAGTLPFAPDTPKNMPK